MYFAEDFSVEILTADDFHLIGAGVTRFVVLSAAQEILCFL